VAAVLLTEEVVVVLPHAAASMSTAAAPSSLAVNVEPDMTTSKVGQTGKNSQWTYLRNSQWTYLRNGPRGVPVQPGRATGKISPSVHPVEHQDSAVPPPRSLTRGKAADAAVRATARES
jgi:hypothetical protein